ncbi:MAG: hypothetical protein ACR2PL_24840 [Dehalococcoidia bacterium]
MVRTAYRTEFGSFGGGSGSDTAGLTGWFVGFGACCNPVAAVCGVGGAGSAGGFVVLGVDPETPVDVVPLAGAAPPLEIVQDAAKEGPEQTDGLHADTT